MSKLRFAFVILACVLPLSACDTDDGPAERLGENVDRAAEDTGERLEDAGERVGEGVEDACEELSDEDC